MSTKARMAASGRRGAAGGGGKGGKLPKEQTVKPGRVSRAGGGEPTPGGYQKNRPDKPAPEGTKIPGF
jgi:hypothetical protein